MAKTNIDLVEYAKAQLGCPYWYGTYGKAASQKLYTQKKKQYPEHYKWDYSSKDAGVKVHDCVGLIKGAIWCDDADDIYPTYNSAQDVSANGMRSRCKIKGNISTLPETLGALVFYDGHVGVYIGNGEVIEARGHAYGVVKTKLKSRKWTSWGLCPFIEYDQAYKPTVKEWQLAAIADGFKFSEHGADGKWGAECEVVAKKAVVKRRVSYKYRNLTKLVQRVVGVVADGKCGAKTKEAIRKYQAAHGLDADGEVGLMTWREMLTK